MSTLLGTALLAPPAAAEDLGSILEVLEESVVTGASHSAERARDAPAMSSVITAEQLRTFGIRHLDEAINFLSLGMFAQDRMSTEEVGARGVALTRDMNSHVLIVLDGVVMNEQAGGAAFLHDVPLEVVDHIEVILGPGSVLYGSNAMLGVINVVTKSARDEGSVGGSVSLGASPPLSSSGAIRSPTLDNMGRDHRFSLNAMQPFTLAGLRGRVLAAVDYEDFQGPEFSFPKQRLAPGSNLELGPHAEPGYWGGPVREQWFQRTHGAYVRAELGNWRLATRASVSRWAAPQLDLYENRGGAYDDPANYNASTLLLSSLTYDDRLSERTLLATKLYFGYSRNLRSRFVLGHDALVPGVPVGVLDPEQCPLGPTGPCRQEAWRLSRWLGLETRVTYDWFGDGAFATLIGADGRLRTAAYEFVSFDANSGKSFGSDPAQTRWHAGGHRKADEYALGTYVQQTVKPWKYVALNTGVRADFDSRVEPEDRLNALSPRVAILTNPLDNLSFKLIYSKAFRAPSFAELHIVNGRLLPNFNGLKPETVSSLEAVGSLRIASHSFTVGAFYARWSELIELQIIRAQAPSVSRYDNVGNIDNYGTNFSYETSLLDTNLRFGINSTLAIARRELTAAQAARNERFGTGSDVPLTVAPKVYGNARLSYDYGSGTAALAASFMGTRIADQAYYAGEPSNLSPRPEAPAQLELRGALTGPVPWSKMAAYTLGGSYAFASHQPYVVGPNQGQPRHLVSQSTEANLALVNRVTVFAGLQLELDGKDAPASNGGNQ